MIIIHKIIGQPHTVDIPAHLERDVLDIDWFDTSKTILRKTTRNGREIGIRKDSSPLLEGDILYKDDSCCIQVSIKPTECIIFQPRSHRDMAVICFEIGNKHIPIFINKEAEVVVEFERPLFRLLDRFGYNPKKETRKLLKTHSLKVNRHKAPTKINIKTNLS